MVEVSQLEGLPIFAGMDRGALQDIAKIASMQTYRATEHIFTEGQPAKNFYILLSGRVSLERDLPHSWLNAEGISKAVIDNLGDHAVFGWSAVLEPGVLTASAHCQNDTEVIEINGKELMRILDAAKNRDAGYVFLKRLAEAVAIRFSKMAERLTREIKELETYRST